MVRTTVETDQTKRIAQQRILIMPSAWQEVMSPMRVVWKSEVSNVPRTESLHSASCSPPPPLPLSHPPVQELVQ
jgi:hypothetical protein